MHFGKIASLFRKYFPCNKFNRKDFNTEGYSKFNVLLKAVKIIFLPFSLSAVPWNTSHQNSHVYNETSIYTLANLRQSSQKLEMQNFEYFCDIIQVFFMIKISCVNKIFEYFFWWSSSSIILWIDKKKTSSALMIIFRIFLVMKFIVYILRIVNTLIRVFFLVI